MRNSQVAEKVKENKKTPKRETARLNVDLPLAEYEVLQRWSEEDGISITSIVRQMIKHSEFIREISSDPKKKLLIEDDGKVMRVIFK